MAEAPELRIFDVTISRIGDRLRVVARRSGELSKLTYEPELPFAEVEALAKLRREVMSNRAARGSVPVALAQSEERIRRALLGDLLLNLSRAPGVHYIELRLHVEVTELYLMDWDDDLWAPSGVLHVAVESPSSWMETFTDLASLTEVRGMFRSGGPAALGRPIHDLPRSGSILDGRARSFGIPANSDSTEGSSPAEPLPEVRGTLYPSITTKPADEIEPNQVVTFVLRLEPTGPSKLSPLAVKFPANWPSVSLRATVSSASFLRPSRESWTQTFEVNRRLTTTPTEWEFLARAFGDQPFYSLTVSFDVGNFPAGAYELRLRRKGAPALSGAPSGGIVSIPRSLRSASLQVLTITAEGPQLRLRLLRGSRELVDGLWSMSTEGFFTKLEAANNLQDIWRFGAALYASLPAELTDFLDSPIFSGSPLLITSSVPIAPFELLRLRPRENGPYLGLDRPVLRWTDKPPMPDLAKLCITGLACIRPEYDLHEALPSAAVEERELTARFAHLPVDRVATLAEFESLLQKASIQLIHFAGHADGNPARLSLQDGKIEPTYFDPGTPLMNAGPFLFLNGCRAATGRTQVPEFQANMMKLLLAANCTGAVAPLTKVESEAARIAANTFYEAVASGKKVGEAVQAVRALALTKDIAPKHAVSYLSYLAFASPSLQLSFDATP